VGRPVFPAAVITRILGLLMLVCSLQVSAARWAAEDDP